jgi:membrane protease YdiL (CAAX protease family)
MTIKKIIRRIEARGKKAPPTIWYSFFVLLVSWALVICIKAFGWSQSPMAAIMSFPMLMAILFILIFREDRFSDIGWKFPGCKFFLIAVFLPLIQIGLALGLSAVLGLISFNEQHFLVHKPTAHPGLNLVLCLPGMFIPFLLLSLPNYLVGWINHLGEEFAWRGYLFRKVSQARKSFLAGVLISGIVWWAWHFPMFWLSPVLKPLKPGQTAVIAVSSVFALLGTTAVFSWLYVRSGSIWAPTIAHLSWNLFRGALTGRLADGAPGLFKGQLWIINGEGMIGNIVTFLTGSVFLCLIVQLDRKARGRQTSGKGMNDMTAHGIRQ